MAGKTYAIRAMNAPGFNRAGERFSDKFWRTIENPAQAILDEPQLISVSTDDPNYHARIGQIPVQGDDDLSPEDKHQSTQTKLTAALATIDQHEKTIKSKDAEIAALKYRLDKHAATDGKVNIGDTGALTDADEAKLKQELPASSPDLARQPMEGAPAMEDAPDAPGAPKPAAAKPTRH